MSTKIRDGKLWKYLFLAASLLVMLTCRPVSARADLVTTDNFQVTNVGTSYIGISVKNPAYNGKTVKSEVELCNASFQVIGSKYDGVFTYASIDVPVKDNRVYYYRIRPYYEEWDSVSRAYVKKYFQDWTGYKAFNTLKVNVKLVSKRGKNVRFKVPRMAGVKGKVKVMMSTAENGKYSKLANIKPGKAFTTSKFKKKTFVYYKNYYYKWDVTLVSGIPCPSWYGPGHFYIYKTYR